MIIIRDAKKGDEFALIELIQGLATYEKEPDAVVNTPENLAVDLFEKKICEAIVVELDSKVVGFALYYTSYSTWKGACVYLEDLYVLEEHRGLHLGSKLFDTIVEIAKERKALRLEWQVLKWNQPAIDFYFRKKATIDREWVNGRMFFDY